MKPLLPFPRAQLLPTLGSRSGDSSAIIGRWQRVDVGGLCNAAGVVVGALHRSTDMVTCTWPKAVHVCQYWRTRKGRRELVSAHCRSYPSK